MLPLSLIPTIHVDESPASACSRVGILVGRSARDVCLDMGLSFSGIVEGRKEPLVSLARLCRHDRFPGVAVVGSGHRFEIAGQAFTRDTLSRKTMRVCPHCVANDLKTGRGPLEARPYGRTLWLVESVRTCPVHRCALVVASEDGRPQMLHDFARLLEPNLDCILEAVEPIGSREPSALERHVLDRLSGTRPSAGWLSGFPTYAACRISETVGAVAEFGPRFRNDNLADADWHRVGGVGYAIADAGAASIGSVLDRLRVAFDSGRGDWGPRQMFGRLYEWLAHENEDPAYDPFRSVIREYVIRTMPIGPGEECLGAKVERRHVHSVQSASRETGKHPKTMRKLLIAAGLVDEAALAMTDERILFDAEAAAPFLRGLADTMSLRHAETYLNAPRPHGRLLMGAGFIKPSISGGGGPGSLNDVFATADLDGFLERLSRDSRPLGPDDGGLFNIPGAAKRANCSTVEIVGLLLESKLATVRLHPAERGYLSVLVDVDEVLPLVRRQEHGGLSLREVMRRLGTNDKVVKALVALGHLPSRRAVNPVNRCPQTVVDPADLNEFAGRYVSLSRLAKDRGAAMRSLPAELAREGVLPCFDPDALNARFYHRSEVGSAGGLAPRRSRTHDVSVDGNAGAAPCAD